MSDTSICPLCNISMDLHSVMVKETKVNGGKTCSPIGWLCPTEDTGTDIISEPIPITFSGAGGGGSGYIQGAPNG